MITILCAKVLIFQGAYPIFNMGSLSKIKAVFSYTGLNIKGEYWESYDEMNKKIIELIG